jgi:hypothetical protein
MEKNEIERKDNLLKKYLEREERKVRNNSLIIRSNSCAKLRDIKSQAITLQNYSTMLSFQSTITGSSPTISRTHLGPTLLIGLSKALSKKQLVS